MSMMLTLLLAALSTEPPDGNLLLNQIDQNTTAKNQMAIIQLRITTRRGVHTIRVRSYVCGDSAFTEYLAPKREKGTKMLKLGRELWIYAPESDRTLRISGHMLRQSVSGSDLSYEDMMEDPKLSNLYTATTISRDSLVGTQVWVLELTAKKSDVAYPMRRLWVDEQRSLILREERYAKSGKLLMTAEVLEVKKLDGRWLATRAVFRNVLKSGGGTEFVIEEIKFDVPIPPGLFSKASLRR